MDVSDIHQKTLECAKRYQSCEAELIDCLQLVLRESVHLKMRYSSLHGYVVQALRFSDDQAYHFTRVAVKALEIPEIKSAIASGALTVAKARRVLSVITPRNQAEWISKATTLSQKELELEVVKVHPKEIVRDRLKPLTQNLVEFRCSIPVEVEKMVKRVCDLESKRLRRSVDLAHVLQAGLEIFLQKNDPVIIAQRNAKKPPSHANSSNRSKPTAQPAAAPPAAIIHQVNLRDRGQCTFRDGLGRRCENTRWVDLHHVKLKSYGGLHTVDNIVTLCSQHHRFLHRHGNQFLKPELHP